MKQRDAEKIHARFVRRLFKDTNKAHAVGLGMEDGRYVTVVEVTKLRNSHRRLERLSLGKKARLNGGKSKLSDDEVAVRVVESEMAVALIPHETALSFHTPQYRPVFGGINIGHFNTTYGTIGSIVYKGGDAYILSDNHILADQNDAEIGDDIYQPGPRASFYEANPECFDEWTEQCADDWDAWTPPIEDKIGELDSFIAIDFTYSQWNLMDAALATLTNRKNAEFRILKGYDNESSGTAVLDETVTYGHKVAWPNIGDPVIKAGARTGVTESVVTRIDVTVRVEYSWWKLADFHHQILISNVVNSQYWGFGAGGDSGSVVVDKNTKEVVGLFFAGSYKNIVANKADYVAEELGFQFYPIKIARETATGKILTKIVDGIVKICTTCAAPTPTPEPTPAPPPCECPCSGMPETINVTVHDDFWAGEVKHEGPFRGTLAQVNPDELYQCTYWGVVINEAETVDYLISVKYCWGWTTAAGVVYGAVNCVSELGVGCGPGFRVIGCPHPISDVVIDVAGPLL